MSGIQTTQNAACQQGRRALGEEEREEKRGEGKVRRKVSLGERAGKKELEPAEKERGGRAPLSSPLLLALTLFAKVQSSGMDRKVKINRRRKDPGGHRAPNFLLLFRRRRRRRKRSEFRFTAAAGAHQKFPTRFEVGRIDRRASERGSDRGGKRQF